HGKDRCQGARSALACRRAAGCRFVRSEQRTVGIGGAAAWFPGEADLAQPLRKELEALRARWQLCCRDGALPRRSDFPPESLVPWIGHIEVVEAVPAQGTVRFRVRLVGTRIVYYEGRDNTGLFLDDVIPAEDRDTVLAPYRQCQEHRQPVYSTFYSCA